MKTNQAQIDLGNNKSCPEAFVLFENIITDRGSKYSVSGGLIECQSDIKKFLLSLKKDKAYAKATHNSFAARISHNGQIWETRNDDGETGAGNVILRIMRKEDVVNTVIVVTRWFGGIKLMADRFKHVQDATKYFVNKL